MSSMTGPAKTLAMRSFFGGIDAWMSQTNICRAAASSVTLRIERTTGGLLFSTTGEALSEIAVFDLQGREIFSSFTGAQQLSWNLRNAAGAPVPNGVYFVRIGNSGELRKIVVIR